MRKGYEWPSGNGIEPVDCVPSHPKDPLAVILGVVHCPRIGELIQLISGGGVYRVDLLDFERDTVRLARDMDQIEVQLTYFMEVPLSTWWDMTMRRHMKISGGSVDSWKMDLWAGADPWEDRHTVMTAGSTTTHVYEIAFSFDGTVQEAAF